MSLIFKKNDEMKIENYRPITLLETDYKIHTKTVANKLGRVCQNLIHKDQAGFIPGKSLFYFFICYFIFIAAVAC